MLKTQKQLFDLLAGRYKSKNALSKHIAAFTNASEKTVEKWISSESVLSYDRLFEIVDFMKLEATDLFEIKDGTVSFQFMPLEMTDLQLYYNYISTLAVVIKRLSEVPGAEIYFMADEIPIFHFMPYKYLTYFKLYSYYCDMQKTEDNYEGKIEMKYEDFVEELEKLDLNKQFTDIGDSYEKITSQEVWDDTILDSLLYKIEEYKSLNRYADPTITEVLLEELTDLVNKFKIKANNARKSSGARFDFFKKRTPVRMGYMLMKGRVPELLTIKLDTINSMGTTDEAMLLMFNNKFKAVQDRSIAFGMGDESKRALFYNSLIEKINRASLSR